MGDLALVVRTLGLLCVFWPAFRDAAGLGRLLVQRGVVFGAGEAQAGFRCRPDRPVQQGAFKLKSPWQRTVLQSGIRHSQIKIFSHRGSRRVHQIHLIAAAPK